MRSISLARVVAEAETLRLKRMVRRLAISAGLAVVALLFVLAALAACHFAIYLALAPSHGEVASALYVLAGDVIIAIAVGAFVVMNGPGRIEKEALVVRQQARLQLRQSLTMGAIIAETTRAIGPRQAANLVRGLVQLMAKRKKE